MVFWMCKAPELKHFIDNLTALPGVYRMLDAKGQILYIGKAKNLKKRVSSYFRGAHDTKTLQLVGQIDSIQVTVTRNEREALLLENNLIKAEKPRYNIIFKDDKSYPYLELTAGEFPRLTFYRGIKKKNKTYFGPYASSREAREALLLLQNLFQLRQCDESFFKNRTRACLQYQIKRCSGSCVGHIAREEYIKDVKLARLFLEGKSQEVLHDLIAKMEVVAEKLNYEKAAQYRDQIALLRNVQEQQIIVKGSEDLDVLGIAVLGDKACVHKLLVRQGKIQGSRQYFPQNTNFIGEPEKLLEAFVVQHYLSANTEQALLPKSILLPCGLPQQLELSILLAEQAKRRVQLVNVVRGDRLRWVTMANTSAEQALHSRTKNLVSNVLALETLLDRVDPITKMACFDVSHLAGTATVVSCVVFDQAGPVKNDYRRFHIKAKTRGDDYAALREAITRYLTRLKLENIPLPDVLMVDGGKGQLSSAQAVFDALQITEIELLAIAKGPRRKAGLETIFRGDGTGWLQLNPDPLALQLLQQLRDEAHRFAVKGHRQLRAGQYRRSTLETIPGVGSKRRLKLLQYFGGLEEVKKASSEELTKVPGIDTKLAQQIYDHLHTKQG